MVKEEVEAILEAQRKEVLGLKSGEGEDEEREEGGEKREKEKERKKKKDEKKEAAPTVILDAEEVIEPTAIVVAAADGGGAGVGLGLERDDASGGKKVKVDEEGNAYTNVGD